MEKIINIDGRDVKLKATGAFLLQYKAQFQRDALRDIAKLQNTQKDGEIDLENIDLEVFYNLAWVLAKSANKEIPPVIEWLDGFDNFPIIEIAPEVIEMVTNCLKTSKKK